MDLSFFKEKRILITGASRGIGRGLARILANAGAVVYALGRAEENLISLQKECPSVIPIVCDLSNWKETENILKEIDPLDYLVNNAGECIREDFYDITEEAVNKLFDVNVKAVMNVSRLVAKKMVDAKKKGAFVNVSSLGSTKQQPGIMAYCATKAAVDMITKCTAMELVSHNIRVNSVNPTIVLTDMGIQIWSDHLEQCKNLLPMGFAEVEDCTNAILFLLSDLSGKTTGESLLVDGGFGAK